MLEMNVSLRRGNFELAGDLRVMEAAAGVFGSSGAGKSTILGLIAGALLPQEGRIVLDGKTLFDSRKGIVMPKEQRPVGAVLQHDRLSPGEAVKKTLVSAYERTLKPRRMLKVGHVVELLELGKVMERQTHELSAGENQRVALARALLKSPQILLLDEPFAPLGWGFRSQLLVLLRRLQSEIGIPTLYASHSLGEILDLTDRLIVIADGRVVSNGTLRQLARDDGLMRALGLGPVENLLSATITQHLIEDGCTLATTFGVELSLPLRRHLPPAARFRFRSAPATSPSPGTT